MSSKSTSVTPDYQKMWSQYSKWQQEDYDWYQGELDRTKARLAATGQQEGSDIWNKEIERVDTEYKDKQKTLHGTATYKILSQNLQYSMAKNEIQKTLKPGWKEVEKRIGFQTVKGYERIDGKSPKGRGMPGIAGGYNRGMGTNFVAEKQQNPFGLGGYGPTFTGGAAFNTNNLSKMNANENDPFTYSRSNMSVEEFYSKQYGGGLKKGGGQALDAEGNPVEKGNPLGMEGTISKARGAGRHAKLEGRLVDWLSQGAWLVDNETEWLGA